MVDTIIQVDNHYTQHESGVECIEIVRHENFNIGCAIKYLWRRKFKGHEIMDLQKAIYYINQEIDIITNKK